MVPVRTLDTRSSFSINRSRYLGSDSKGNPESVILGVGCDGMRLSPLGTSIQLYQSRMIDEYGAFGGMTTVK
jgi:hypothetical protein